MPSQSGSVYGLTLLCPILDDDRAVPSHDLQIREYLAQLSTGAGSPFAVAPGTHIARLAVLDDVIYVGMPACEEHLKSKYLVFESNCDGNFDTYLVGLARSIPDHLDNIWSHCAEYPGAADIPSFLSYMKKCQIETTFFFAPVNNKTVTETLVALQAKQAVADFITAHQGMDAAQTQQDFLSFIPVLQAMPAPLPATVPMHRYIKTGGHNE